MNNKSLKFKITLKLFSKNNIHSEYRLWKDKYNRLMKDTVIFWLNIINFKAIKQEIMTNNLMKLNMNYNVLKKWLHNYLLKFNKTLIVKVKKKKLYHKSLSYTMKISFIGKINKSENLSLKSISRDKMHKNWKLISMKFKNNC